MTPGASTLGSERARRATLVWTALAALVYSMTWQEAVHGTDWRWFVLWLDDPNVVHPQHPGYLAVARGLSWLLTPLGLDSFDVLRVLSILGGAITVGGVHRLAVATGGDARFARFAAVLAIVTPALWHHATVVELHTPFMAVMVWAAVVAVGLLRRADAPQGFRRVVALGLLSGLATVMHATGHLLVLVFGLAILWRAGSRGLGWSLRSAAVYALVHIAVWAAVFWILRATGELPESVRAFQAQPEALGSADNPLDYLLQWWAGTEFATQFGPTALREWGESFAPFSVFVLAGLFVRRTRVLVLLLLIACTAYLLATVVLVHAWTDERGAYLLPLLPPALLITLQVTPRRWWYVAVAVTALCGAFLRGDPDHGPPDREFGRAVATLAERQPTVFFVADWHEMDSAFVVNPRLDLKVGNKEYDDLAMAQQQQGFAVTPAMVAGWLSLIADETRQKGARLVVTDRAVTWMTEQVPAFGEGWTMFASSAPAARLAADSGVAGWVVE